MWIEKENVPRIARAALMFNPNGIEPIAAPVQSAADIARVFDRLGNRPDVGLVLPPDVFMSTKVNLDLVALLAARTHLPTIYSYRYMVAAGVLISYGIDSTDLYRRAPAYVDRILKGAKPADLPVQLPTKLELAINLKTAKSLGLDMPATLLGRADEVIE